jgi:hypothetical protein
LDGRQRKKSYRGHIGHGKFGVKRRKTIKAHFITNKMAFYLAISKITTIFATDTEKNIINH